MDITVDHRLDKEVDCLWSEKEVVPILHSDLDDDIKHGKEPPSLGYEMTPRRKQSLLIQVTVLGSIDVIAPTLIFYLYKYYAGNYQSEPELTYTWVTCASGTLELLQWPLRTYFLYKDNFARSGDPLNAEKRKGWAKIRPYFTHQDFFGLQYLLANIIGSIGLTLCCSLGGSKGSFPLLVISIPTVILHLGLVIGLTSILTAYKIKTPCRISSLPAGQIFRPAVYFIWEDLVAVDGGGSYEFRKRLSKRYESSPPFQRLMQHLTLIFTQWAIILFLVSLVLVVCNVQGDLDQDIVMGVIVGFSVLWSIIIAIISWRYAQRGLQYEKDWWSEMSSKQRDSHLEK